MPPLEDNHNHKQHMQPKYELQQYLPPTELNCYLLNSVKKYIDKFLVSPFPSSARLIVMCYQTNTKSLILLILIIPLTYLNQLMPRINRIHSYVYRQASFNRW